MRILIDINHPAHVHLFKNAIRVWEERGYQCLVVARSKDVTINLLEKYGIPYKVGSYQRSGLFGLFVELVVRTMRLVRFGRRFNPTLMLSVASPPAAFTAFLLNIPHLAFDDTESANVGKWLYLPFTKTVYTPNSFDRDLGKKQKRYEGYHELAYLHPKYIEKPDEILCQLGVARRPYYLIRFVKFLASHDISHTGFSASEKTALIEMLSAQGELFISSEGQPYIQWWNRAVRIEADSFHAILSGAKMCVSEGGTTATEAAILGVPTILLTHVKSGNWQELSVKYGLIKRFDNSTLALRQVAIWLANGDELEESWTGRRKQLLNDKIDVTEYIVGEIEKYAT